MARAKARASLMVDIVLRLVSGGVPARQQGPSGWPCCIRAGRRVNHRLLMICLGTSATFGSLPDFVGTDPAKLNKNGGLGNYHT